VKIHRSVIEEEQEEEEGGGGGGGGEEGGEEEEENKCTLYGNTRWFKYDRDYLCVNKSQFVPVIFEH
jgi:hypothetical protein